MSFVAHCEFHWRATSTDSPQILTHSYSINTCSSKKGLRKNLVLHCNPYENKFCRLVCKQPKTTPRILLSEPRVLDIKDCIFKRQFFFCSLHPSILKIIIPSLWTLWIPDELGLCLMYVLWWILKWHQLKYWHATFGMGIEKQFGKKTS